MAMTNKETVRKKFDGFAIASFVIMLGCNLFLQLDTYLQFMSASFGRSFIFFLALLFILLFILSIIFGIVAIKRIKKDNNRRGNVLSYIGIVVSLLSLIFYGVGIILAIGWGAI